MGAGVLFRGSISADSLGVTVLSHMCADLSSCMIAIEATTLGPFGSGLLKLLNLETQHCQAFSAWVGFWPIQDVYLSPGAKFMALLLFPLYVRYLMHAKHDSHYIAQLLDAKACQMPNVVSLLPKPYTLSCLPHAICSRDACMLMT